MKVTAGRSCTCISPTRYSAGLGACLSTAGSAAKVANVPSRMTAQVKQDFMQPIISADLRDSTLFTYCDTRSKSAQTPVLGVAVVFSMESLWLKSTSKYGYVFHGDLSKSLSGTHCPAQLPYKTLTPFLWRFWTIGLSVTKSASNALFPNCDFFAIGSGKKAPEVGQLATGLAMYPKRVCPKPGEDKCGSGGFLPNGQTLAGVS